MPDHSKLINQLKLLLGAYRSHIYAKSPCTCMQQMVMTSRQYQTEKDQRTRIIPTLGYHMAPCFTLHLSCSLFPGPESSNQFSDPT